MIFNLTCPYCHSDVHQTVIPYIIEQDLYRYRFSCKCRDEEEDFRYNEHAAYQTYLEERENANITNFVKYFGGLGTFDDLQKKIDKHCNKFHGNCEDCPWSMLGFLLNGDHSCTAVWSWLDEKGVKDGKS